MEFLLLQKNESLMNAEKTVKKDTEVLNEQLKQWESTYVKYPDLQ